MSKRNIHKKKRLRYSERVFYIVVCIIILIALVFGIYKETTKTNSDVIRKNIYNFSDNVDLDYNVNLIDNPFINKDSLATKNVYVTDMISDMDFLVNYNYKGSDKAKIHYKYNITAKVIATSELDGKEYKVMDKSEILLDNKEGNSDGDFNIKENVKVDFNKYNNEIKGFQENYLMYSKGKLFIDFNIETETEIEGKKEKNNFTNGIVLNLSDEITKVEGELHKENKKDISIEKSIPGISDVNLLIVYFVIGIIDIYALFYVIFNTRVTHSIRNEYKLELNAILKGCGEKIVSVNDKIDTEHTNEVTVKDFGELLKLSEELMEPILYWNDDNENEAWFYIIKNKITYKYVLEKF